MHNTWSLISHLRRTGFSDNIILTISCHYCRIFVYLDTIHTLRAEFNYTNTFQKVFFSRNFLRESIFLLHISRFLKHPKWQTSLQKYPKSKKFYLNLWCIVNDLNYTTNRYILMSVFIGGNILLLTNSSTRLKDNTVIYKCKYWI